MEMTEQTTFPMFPMGWGGVGVYVCVCVCGVWRGGGGGVERCDF